MGFNETGIIGDKMIGFKEKISAINFGKNTATEVKSYSLKGYLDSFLRESDIGTETLRIYGKAISYFIKWADGMIVTPSIVKTYKSYLINIGLTPNSVSIYLTAIKQFFGYLVERGIILHNPASEVKRPKIPRVHQRDALSREQARLLLVSICRDSIKGCRDYAMINLMLRTGIREIEASRVLIGDIEEKEGKIILNIHGKGRDSKDSFVVLTDAAYQPIKDYIALRGIVLPNMPLFSSLADSGKMLSTRAIRKIISHYLILSGIKSRRITPHSLRHTAITLAIAGGNGNNLIQVQQMARHANISTTIGYYHEFERLNNAAENCISI